MKIEIDVDVYIELLEDRRALAKEHFGWTIPDGVWDHLIEMIEECGVGEQSSPSYIIDNVAVNGDYGYIEEYNDFDSIVDMAKDELDNDFTEESLKIYIQENIDALIESCQLEKSCFFIYKEPDSEYGRGICYSL